jgi:type II secretory pathway pseudopilin PulG
MRTERSGFSLFEVVVYMAIVAIMMVAILALAAENLSSRVKAVAMQRVNYQSQFVLDRLSRDVQAATAIDVTDFASNILTVTLADGTTRQYEVVAGKLFVSVNSAAAVALTSDAVIVTTFTLDDRTTVGSDVHAVGIELTLTTAATNVSPEYAASQTLNSTVSRRL